MTSLRLSSVVRWVLALALVIGAAVGLASQWDKTVTRIDELSIANVVIAFVIGTIGQATTVFAWRAVLSDLGSTMPILPAARVFFVGQLGKYVPGGVWSFVVHMELGKTFDVPRARSAAATALSMAYGITMAFLLALVLIPLDASVSLPPYVLLLVVPLLCVLHPRVLQICLKLANKVLRGQPFEAHPTMGGTLRACGWMLVAWVLLGVHAWVLAGDVGASRASLPVAIGVIPLAWAIGLLAIVVPAGIGVREAALAALLSPSIGVSAATLVALVSRLLLIAGDIVLAGIGYLAQRLSAGAPERSAARR